MILKKMQTKHYNGFRFEVCWLNCNGFMDVVKKAWEKAAQTNDPARKLHIKLSRTASALRKWYKNLQKEAAFQEDIANEVIFQLDLAQEERELTPDERLLRQFLKARLLGIAAFERRARLDWIKSGDANTRFFHLRANGLRRKNHIPSLVSADGAEVTDHAAKANILHKHFVNLLGKTSQRQNRLNWDALGIQLVNLSHLDAPFSLDELKEAVFGLHSEKAPGPDGFTGIFYKRCWEIIREDLLSALNSLFVTLPRNWNLLNTANITLIPKKDVVSSATDYRPLSLMHSFAKLVGKLMASRLAPELCFKLEDGLIKTNAAYVTSCRKMLITYFWNALTPKKFGMGYLSLIPMLLILPQDPIQFLVGGKRS
ncbi:uncharacterized protein [Lolium perenne]|uniref:uncharacterized protein n=1 Tax=Lolium perenne TaxID=4522 RepID=UPI0021F57A04|nr:uncharacterized protein LOC127346739 [Lolium perenne]